MDITSVIEPVAGEASRTDGAVFPTCIDETRSGGRYIKEYAGSGFLNFNGDFVAGEKYTLSISMYPKAGYKYSK